MKEIKKPKYTQDDYAEKTRRLVDTDDKYKLFFKKRTITKRSECLASGQDRQQEDYLDEDLLKEPIDLKGVERIEYEFANYYRLVTISIKIDKNNDDHIWKPGDNYVTYTFNGNDEMFESNYRAPRCNITNRHYFNTKTLEMFEIEPHIITYIGGCKAEGNKFKQDGYKQWPYACTGYYMQPKMSLEIIEQSGIKEGPFYNSLETARQARKLYEDFFPKWTLR